MSEKKEIRLDKLLLDSKNPRIGAADTQRDALQKILDDQEDKLARLAEDIAEDGLSPMEKLLVIQEKTGSDKYVVVEGNRRLAALKILANPAVLPSLKIKESLQKRFERIAQNFDLKNIEPIECSVCAKREDATKWVYLRHTGENGGRGVVNWGGVETARFRGTDPALQALAFVDAHGNLDAHHKGMLGKAFPITTLERLLSSKEVRPLIGVEVKNGKLKSALPGNELIKPLRRIVLDLAEGTVNVSDLKNSLQQVNYVKSILSEDGPDHSKKGLQREVADYKDSEFAPAKAKSSEKKAKAPYDPSTRKTVVPKGVRLNISTAKIAEIYNELRYLRMEDFPNACAVLLRVFLELSVDAYLAKNGIKTYVVINGHNRDKSLADKLKEVVDHLVANMGCAKKDFAAVTRSLHDKSSPLNIELLHSYVHSRFSTPSPRDLRVAWDHAEPVFKQIWK